jgi:hypothetical protein
MSVRHTGLRLVVGAVALLLTMTALMQACAVVGEPVLANPDADTMPPGFVPGPVFGVGSCCADGTYTEVPPVDCPRSTCAGTSAYAVCVGSSYGGCTCTEPTTVPDASSFGPCGSGGSKGSLGGGATGAAGSGTGSGSESEGGIGVRDATLFDVGDLGDCSGQTAVKVRASECGSCSGKLAYLLCNGLFFSSCSCDLPPGYTLVDGGWVLEAGSSDAAPSDTASEPASPEDAAATDGGRDATSAPEDGPESSTRVD